MIMRRKEEGPIGRLSGHCSHGGASTIAAVQTTTVKLITADAINKVRLRLFTSRALYATRLKVLLFLRVSAWTILSVPAATVWCTMYPS